MNEVQQGPKGRMFNPINSLRNDIAKDKASFYGAIVFLCALILIYVFAFLFYSEIEPERIGGAKADETFEFNVQPPKEYDWSVFPAVAGHSLEQVETLRLAYKISGGDKDFLFMLKGENGAISIDRKSDVPGEPSYGYCQIHAGYHPEIVNDPRFFTDKQWQLEQCYKLWKGGTKFYGFANKWKVKHFFTFGKSYANI